MFRNLFYTFKTAPQLVSKSVALELVHGVFIGAPTGFLLLIIKELFTTQPHQGRLWLYVSLMAVLLIAQLFLSVKTIVTTNDMIYTISTNLRIRLGNRLQHLSLGTFKQRDPG